MIIIVGAGLAGLACASRLEEAGEEWLLLDAATKPGGRVATEVTADGYRLDRGFQVLLDSYPTARRLLDMEALHPSYFDSGALLINRDPSGNLEFSRFLNPLAHPNHALGSLLSPAFSWSEKLSLAAHALVQILTPDGWLLKNETGHSTIEELHRLGLDRGMHKRFLKPFFSGVFLENNLETEASIFRYDLKKFALGRALLPSCGMGAIPQQLASRLPAARQKYGTKVTALHRNGDRFTGVTLDDGSEMECDELVLATDEQGTRFLLGLPPGRDWHAVTTLYFTGESPLYEGGLIVLPSCDNGQVSNFCDLTNITADYAPHGRRLLSATLLNPQAVDNQILVSLVQAEITSMFPAFADWQFLKELSIRQALPPRLPGYGKELMATRFASNLSLAGDQVTLASIEAALSSGLDVAESLLAKS